MTDNEKVEVQEATIKRLVDALLANISAFQEAPRILDRKGVSQGSAFLGQEALHATIELSEAEDESPAVEKIVEDIRKESEEQMKEQKKKAEKALEKFEKRMAEEEKIGGRHGDYIA